jgi:hypothetical protein
MAMSWRHYMAEEQNFILQSPAGEKLSNSHRADCALTAIVGNAKRPMAALWPLPTL